MPPDGGGLGLTEQLQSPTPGGFSWAWALFSQQLSLFSEHSGFTPVVQERGFQGKGISCSRTESRKMLAGGWRDRPDSIKTDYIGLKIQPNDGSLPPLD